MGVGGKEMNSKHDMAAQVDKVERSTINGAHSFWNSALYKASASGAVRELSAVNDARQHRIREDNAHPHGADVVTYKPTKNRIRTLEISNS